MHDTAVHTGARHTAYAGTGAGGSRRAPSRSPGFLARTGALTVRGLLGFPLALAAVPMALVGAGRAAARMQLAALRRFGPPDPRRTPAGAGAERSASAGADGAKPARVLRHSGTVLLPSLAAFVLTALCLWGVYSGYLYFVRPDASPALGHPFTADHLFDTSWGGPTLVGAWSIHALTVLGWHVLSLPVLRGLSALQARATRAMLGC